MHFKVFFILSGALILFNCGRNESDQNNRTERQKTSPFNFPNVNECMKTALHYLDEVDPDTYDSLDSRYFHKILDYKNEKAVDIVKQLLKLKYELEIESEQPLSKGDRDTIIEKMNDLRHELKHFKKETVGYVFIHTFLSKGDTLSAIICMSENCDHTEANIIKTIKDIDPDDYSYRVRTLE